MRSEEAAVPREVHLDGALVRGFVWIGGVKWSGQVLAWVASLVVVRLLTPSDYGVVAMATVYLGFLTLLSDAGLQGAVVASKSLTSEQERHLNSLALLVAGACCLAAMATAFPLGRIYAAPALPAVMMVLAAGCLASGWQTLPAALLRREMRFAVLARIDGVRTLVAALLPIGLALLHWHYWSLVLGMLAANVVAAALSFASRPVGVARARLAVMGEPLQLSTHVLLSSVFWYIYANADFVIAGRVLGEAALGAYLIGWALASLPVEKVTSLASSVAPAFYSAVQTEPAALRRYLLALTETIAIVTFPAAIGLALIADEVVNLVLGPRWTAAIGPLRLLAAITSVRCIVPLLPPILNVTGESRFGMWHAVACAIVLPGGFYAGSHWGIVGIAAAWVVLYPVIAVPLYWRVLRRIDLPLGRYLRALAPALSGSAAMVAVVLALRRWLGTPIPLSLQLAVQVAAGAAAYAATILTFHRTRLQAFWQVLQYARSKPAEVVHVAGDEG